MALTDFLTQIADSIRSKDGTTEPIVATDFPQRILDIPSGGSELPSTIKTGTFTVAEDTTDTITIPHGLGSAPVQVSIFPENAEYVIGNIAYSFLGGDIIMPYVIVTVNTKALAYKASVFSINCDETNITITNSNGMYMFRAGLVYRWFALGESA